MSGRLFRSSVPRGQSRVVGVKERAREAAIVGPTDACDCGRVKRRRSEACARCLWLDGERAMKRAVVEALRTLVRATVDEITKECDAWRESVDRTLREMLLDGRVSRLWEEFEWEGSVDDRRVVSRLGTRRFGGRWSYALSG